MGLLFFAIIGDADTNFVQTNRHVLRVCARTSIRLAHEDRFTRDRQAVFGIASEIAVRALQAGGLAPPEGCGIHSITEGLVVLWNGAPNTLTDLFNLRGKPSLDQSCPLKVPLVRAPE